MKNKARLAFEMLEMEMQVLDVCSQTEIIGGDGVIRSGTGTATDPYVITTYVNVNAASFGGETSAGYKGVMSGINTMNSQSAIALNNQYYKLNVVASSDFEHTVGNITWNTTQIIGTNNIPSSLGSTTLAATDSNNQIGLFKDRINNYSQNVGTNGSTGVMTQQEYDEYVYQRATIHEIGHTLGLDDGQGNPVMNNFAEDGSTVPGDYNSTAIEDMMGGGKIYFGSTGGETPPAELAYLPVSTGFDEFGYFVVKSYSGIPSSTGDVDYSQYYIAHPYYDPNVAVTDGVNWDGVQISSIISTGVDDIGSFTQFYYTDQYGNQNIGVKHNFTSTGGGETTGQ